MAAMERAPRLAFGLVLVSACSSSTSPGQAGDAGRAPDHDAGGHTNRDAAEGAAPKGGRDGGAEGGREAGCGELTGDDQPTCSGDGDSLGDCVGGVPHVQTCPYGCLHGEDGGASSCLLAKATNFSCIGAYGTVPVNDGNYYLSEFGCYIAPDGGVVTDPGDNCIPSCLSQALAAGLCPAGSTGPECEEAIGWYTADGARFGCLARLRVDNPLNGKAVIAVALDYGPGCAGENRVSHAVLDSSGPVNDYLYGGPEGSGCGAVVHVVQVADTTPLGPL
jgi:hypothetical protein